MDNLVHWKSFITIILLLRKIIFKCGSQFRCTTVHNSCPIKNPFFLCNVVISNLSGVFINPLKEFAVDRDILIRRKWERCFGKDFCNTGRNLICFFGTLIIGQMHWSFFIVTVDKTLCFLHRDFAFNILNGCINQIFRWFESVHRLKSNCRTPSISLMSFIRFRLPQIFLKRVFFHIHYLAS